MRIFVIGKKSVYLNDSKIMLRFDTLDPNIETVIESDWLGISLKLANDSLKTTWLFDKWNRQYSYKKCSIEEITDAESLNAYCNCTVEELSGSLEDYKLPSIEMYKSPEVSYKTKRDMYVTDEMIAAIDGKGRAFSFIYGDAPEVNKSGVASHDRVVCERRVCLSCGSVHISSPKISKCPDCERLLNSNYQAVDKTFKEHRQKYFKHSLWDSMVYPRLKSKISNLCRYVEMLPNGFRISMVMCEITMDNGVITKSWSVPYEVVHEIGGEIKSYHNMRTQKLECSAFEALFSKKHNKSKIDFFSVFKGYDNFVDMMLDNERILKMCGFIDVLKYINNFYEMEEFFYEFVAILNQYPALEQIIKAGYVKLFQQAYACIESGSTNAVKDALNDFGKLIDNSGTTSDKSMRLPRYIVDYLVMKDAPINEYMFWLDIYELTRMSKENFENTINSFSFICVNSQISTDSIGNILKYGYQLDRLMRYILKNVKNFEGKFPLVVRHLKDYLSMCETIGVEPDKYPMDLKKQHDDIVAVYNSRKVEFNNKYISEVAAKCKAWMQQFEKDDKRPEGYDEYIIVFPEAETDFIEEGNKQHNCVSSYAKHVAEQRCIVYFLRKKDSPEESFITAEVNNGRGQFLLSNNRTVKDNELNEIGRYIKNKILSGIKEGEINPIAD